MLKREVALRRANITYKPLRALSVFIVAAFASLLPLASQTQHQNAKERKVITRVGPEYPAPLKRMNIGGVVRVEVVIAPNGAVTSTTLLGGSPYLGQAAMAAIKEWRYAPAPFTETLVVELEFDPHR